MRTAVFTSALPQDGSYAGLDVEGEQGGGVQCVEIVQLVDFDPVQLLDERFYFELGELGLEKSGTELEGLHATFGAACQSKISHERW